MVIPNNPDADFSMIVRLNMQTHPRIRDVLDVFQKESIAPCKREKRECVATKIIHPLNMQSDIHSCSCLF